MNRRRSARFAQPGHVWWSRCNEAFQQHGWLADQSRGGLSFVSPYARHLRSGDTIVISDHKGSRSDSAARTSRFAVCRVEPYDDELSLVACAAQRP